MTTALALPGTARLPQDVLDRMVLTSDHGSPVVIEGVACGRLRDQPDRAYYVVWRHIADPGIFQRLQVDEATYLTVQRVLDFIKEASFNSHFSGQSLTPRLT